MLFRSSALILKCNFLHINGEIIIGHSHTIYFTATGLMSKLNSELWIKKEYFSYGLTLAKIQLVVFSQFFIFTSTNSQRK